MMRISGRSAVVLLVAAAVSHADVPRLIHYQGKLITLTGAIMPGPVAIRARLYDSPSASTPVLFDETHPVVTLNRGLFSVLLGSQTGGGVPDAVLAGTNVYLGIAIDGAAELSPRIRIATAPYAGKTRSAEQLVKPGTVDAGVTLDAAGRVGIGTTTPDVTALVDMATTTGGLLIPRLTEAQRDALINPALGLQIFNTTSNCLNLWVGSTWKQACYDCSFTAPVAGNNGPLCAGSSLQLTATSILNATYAWTGPNGFTSSSQNPSIPNATPAATGPYSVTATVAGCTSNPVTTLATINSVPSAPAIGSNSPICVGATLNLTSSAVSGGTYNWTGPNGFTSTQQNPEILNATAAAGGQYTLLVTVNGCTSPPAITNVAVSQVPAAPGSITGTTSLCRNTTGSVYSIADVPGATTYTWTAPPGATVASGQGTAFATINFGTQSGNVSVTAGNSCGSSAATTLAINVMGASGSQDFTYTGGIVNFTVPTCVTQVTVEAWGAQGGLGNGGLGARMRGDISVTPGESLRVLVGQRGSTNSYGGGGGGSFVTRANNTPLVIAGGGGGQAGASSSAGGAGQTGTAGGSSGSVNGGDNGNGAPRGGENGTGGCGYPGSGGGGLLTNGSPNNNGGGVAFVNGGTGGVDPSDDCVSQATGGFGGGGSGGNGGGGAGGYSGGAGGNNIYPNPGYLGGGGGGSFNSGANQSNSAGVQSGNGQVTISW